jgi:2-oxoisovalerate dehydrogenase E1 component beta subunit
MPRVALIEALTMAMRHELKNDPRVVLLGEDVGVNGGVFRATAGLQREFGKERVMDTPLSENMISGMSVGLAAQGMVPVAEIQFTGFIYPAVDQLISHAGRLRHRTRGRMSCPLVLRAPYGGGIHAPEHHSESTEAMFAHMPGIRVVIPASPTRAYGLLLAAIRDPDPVVFLEPKRIYRLVKQEVADDGQALPLDTCYILREGEDVTVVTWGAMTYESMKAASQLAEEGISCEVIDLATISPIDRVTILESLEKTGRIVVVSEAPRQCGVASEIAAIVAEEGIYFMRAPFRRVTGYDTVMPLFRREMDYLPSVDRVVHAIRETLED